MGIFICFSEVISMKKKDAKGVRHFFTYFRLFVCVLIIGSAFVLKYTNAPALQKVSDAISREIEVDKAIEVINSGIGQEKLKEVFKQEAPNEFSEERQEENDEEDFEEFYLGDTKDMILEEKEKAEETAKTLSIEAMSFDMSTEELSDDTAAEPYRIPPPSYCSYKNERIGFKHTLPLNGVVTSKFGYRDHPIIEDASFHTGLDIAAKSGTAIKAFADGKVIEAGQNATYGNYLLIEHADGIRSFYGHNSRLNVKKGQSVSIGQKIAEVGTTGMSTGPHLHFEIRKGSVRLDPSYYIFAERV